VRHCLGLVWSVDPGNSCLEDEFSAALFRFGFERGSREQLLERGSDAGHSAQSSDSGVPMVGQHTSYSRATKDL
jgi:hypothetical protein